jgi:Ca2+-binding RTX toxin-like protein
MYSTLGTNTGSTSFDFTPAGFLANSLSGLELSGGGPGALTFTTGFGSCQLQGIEATLHDGAKPASTNAFFYIAVSDTQYWSVDRTQQVDSVSFTTQNAFFSNQSGTGGSLPTINEVLACTTVADLLNSQASLALYGSSVGDFLRLGNAGGLALGQAGDDTLLGAAGVDTLGGANGDDDVDGAGGNDSLGGGDGNDTLRGAGGDDVLHAEAGADSLFGGAGNDDLNGGTEDDYLDGGEDNDYLMLGLGDDTALGGTGDDTLDDEGGADSMTGGAGDDTYFVNDAGDLCIEDALTSDTDLVVTELVSLTLAPNVEDLWSIGSAPFTGTGNSSDNWITGARPGIDTEVIGLSGADTLNGLGGHDKLEGGAGDDSVIGGNGDDSLLGGGGADRLNGGAGDDILTGGASSDTLIGGDGSDSYYLEAATDVISETGLTGIDTVYAQFNYTLGNTLENLVLIASAATGTGSELANQVTGNDASNTLTGAGGDDTIQGLDGDDVLDGGLRKDTLYGGAGNDTIEGGIGDDTIGNGEDVLYGGDGNDLLQGGDDNDTLLGGAGNDTLDGGDGLNDLDGGGGNDVLYVHNGDAVSLGHGVGITTLVIIFDSLLQLGAGDHSVVINGAGAIGGAGNETITGSSAANVLRGGGGADRLDGKGGNDTLTGNSGADKFVFSTALNASNVDRITDFVHGKDKILLDDDTFTALGVSGTAAGVNLTAAKFYVGTAAHDSNDRIIYDSSTGKLYYDEDGTGDVAQQLFAILTTKPALSETDFKIIA